MINLRKFQCRVTDNKAYRNVRASYVNCMHKVEFLHAQIQEFSSGGGGGPGQSDKKKALTFFFVFFSPQLILQKSNGQFQRNQSLLKVPEGVQHFPGGGGVQLFPGGSNCLFPIETHITCDFPGGGVRTPCPPLDPHLFYDLAAGSVCLHAIT